MKNVIEAISGREKRGPSIGAVWGFPQRTDLTSLSPVCPPDRAQAYLEAYLRILADGAGLWLGTLRLAAQHLESVARKEQA